jgi:hypothetical protein
MKVSEFRQLIKEEVRKVLSEDNLDRGPKRIELYDKNNKAITIANFFRDEIFIYRNMNHNNDKARLVVNPTITPQRIITQFVKLGVVEKLNNKYILADKYTNYKMIELAKMLKNVTLDLSQSK